MTILRKKHTCQYLEPKLLEATRYEMNAGHNNGFHKVKITSKIKVCIVCNKEYQHEFKEEKMNTKGCA